MSNAPNQPEGNFGAQQFQKLQFSHKPHEEMGGADPALVVKQRLQKPAGILKLLALLSLLILFAGMAFQLVQLSLQREAWLNVWDQAAMQSILAAKQSQSAFVSSQLTPDEEDQFKRQQNWNKNLYTIWMGSTAVGYFLAMCFSTLIAVSAHKMAKLNGYKQGWTACILAMLPCTNPLFLFNIPVAIWVMKILSDHDVKMAFRAHGG